MKGFIVYPTYRIKKNKAYIYLFGRLENGETFVTINQTRPYFFIRKKDEKEAKGIIKEQAELESTKLKDFENEEVMKVVLDNPRNVPGIRDQLHEEDIKTYEADVRFVYRFLIDNKIRGSVEIKGEYGTGGLKVDRVYKEPELTPAEYEPDLKVLSFDIETNKDNGDLWAISLYTDDYKKVLVKKKGDFENAESFDNEKDLLKRFAELVEKIDPDILTGWNVIDFDLDFLEKKFKEHNIPFKLGRTDDRCTLRRYESYMRDSTADFPGRQVLDGIHLMRISFIRLEDYKLDTAAEEFLGENKVITKTGKEKYNEIHDAYENNTQKLVDYNLEDSRLVFDILEESGVLELSVQRSLITGMQLDRVKASVASLDNLYLAALRDRGYVAETRDYKERERRITGGYVMESKPGIFDYVIVCDFKSLYPSLMRTFNIDPLMYVPKDREADNVIVAPNGARFRKEKGIIPALLEDLWERRNTAKKENNKLKSNAIKVLMNSIFGVLANPNCRFYSFEMANAITHFGQHFIKMTADKIREKGYEVIYGDTDSIFVDLDVDDYEKAKEIGNEIEGFTNEFFTEYIHDKYDVESFMELEFEKVYKRFMMPKIRGTESGAKKRYAGLIKTDEDERLEFVGLEFVRRDWTDVAKKFQKELIQKVFNKENPDDYIRDFVGKLRLGEFDDLLIYRKALRKAPEDYTKTTPPHVKAARKMEEVTTSIIEYKMTVDGPEPVGNVSHTIDYDHYIEKQIKPLANQVLTFFNTKFDDVLKGTKQTKLDGF